MSRGERGWGPSFDVTNSAAAEMSWGGKQVRLCLGGCTAVRGRVRFTRTLNSRVSGGSETQYLASTTLAWAVVLWGMSRSRPAACVRHWTATKTASRASEGNWLFEALLESCSAEAKGLESRDDIGQ